MRRWRRSWIADAATLTAIVKPILTMARQDRRMIEGASTGPAWAIRVQQARRPTVASVGPFDRLDQGWRNREARRVGAGAAVGLALLNLFSAALALGGHGADGAPWAWRLHLSTPFLCIVAAVILLLLGARLFRRPSVLLAALVLAWSIADLCALSLVAYGHAPFKGVSALLALAAVLGLRGQLAHQQARRSGALPPAGTTAAAIMDR
jgi:peptidoglycan/LPS O-acetylase OafA/YrhL